MRWCVLALAACGAAPKVLDRPVEHRPVVSGISDSAAEAARLFAERLDEGKLRAAIAVWRRAVAERDDDAGSYAMLARACYFLADGFLPGRPEAKQVFADGAAFAERGLRARFPRFEELRRAGAEVEQAALGLPAEAAPLLYWWAQDTIRWADLDGWTTAAGVYKHVFAVMDMVRRLDETIDGAGPDRFFGAARAESPAIAGGSLDESRAFFARALELAPGWLQNRVDLAAHLARKTGDRKLYEESLKIVAETPSGGVPEQELAKRKGRALGPW